MPRKRPETPMNIDRFIAEVRSYKDRTGKANKDVAEDVGIELGYLHKILYRDKPLTLQVVEKAAPLWGLTVHDFILGEPSQPGDHPRDEPFGNIMAILGANMTEAWKKRLQELAEAAQEGPTWEEVQAKKKKGKG